MATLAPPPRLSPPARSPRRLPRRRRTGEAARLWRRVFRRVLDHECSEVAGEMAFDFSLSIFPAALFLAALVGPMGITPEHVSQALNVLGIFLHEMVREMVEENVRNLVAAQSQKVLTIGLLGAVWASSSAISATIKALNRANGVREARAFWYRRLLSVGLVLSGGVGLIVSFNLLIMGTWIEEELLARLGFGVPLTI
ncbi:MAG: YihY/virulence factor BrkB family protein, partial [Candidatus Latescibacteria bacterium]|nr:YihY/virulence factor BrkB family protein [Candidatus Latescibacterota bacterium]